jgi:D-glycero-alpha-D-manno-heptose-7-phosphate kinase
MIVTKTPLRISFVGGGSDRPSFYSEEPGACVAAAIDKYVYVAVNPKYDGSIRAAYSQTENVATVDELQHELIREALLATGVRGVEVHSIADVPGGTGLGSSSAFTVGLLKALGPNRQAGDLAEGACNIEIGCCRKPIGKQDQYTAAHGGLNLLQFTDIYTSVKSIKCNLEALSAHCLLLDTGLTRTGDAGAHLSSQAQDRDDVRQLAHLAHFFMHRLTQGDLAACGGVMDTAWMVKRKYVSTDRLDAWYSQAYSAGAWGGKLCGAGGGGFLLFLAPPERHEKIIAALKLRHVPITVGVKGCEVVYGN